MISNLEIDALMTSTAVVVREYVSAEVASMTARIEAFEKRLMDEVRDRIKDIPAGPRGEKGEPGESIIGLAGPEGKPGECIIGPAGRDGIDGKDADPVDVEKVIAEVVKLIPVPRDGKDGPQGPPLDHEQVRVAIEAEVAKTAAAMPAPKDGEPGKPGRDAEPIHPDTVSLMVVTEVAKAVAVIPKAENGRDGAPGRDALEIEILPCIDMEKSYPRGTYARYCGGIVRAMRTTNPKGPILADWEIIVAGISAVTFIQGEDPREMSIDCCLTTGDHAVSKFYVPMLLYRDIYRAGETYTKGDVVTWDGSAWHCIADSTKSAPGVTPSAWRLIVKRGRDAKDGNDGKVGPQGPAGPSGRDLTQMDFSGNKH